MTRLHQLNRRMFELKHNGGISRDEYQTYKDVLNWIEFSRAYIGDRLPVRGARPLLDKLNQEAS